MFLQDWKIQKKNQKYEQVINRKKMQQMEEEARMQIKSNEYIDKTLKIMA